MLGRTTYATSFLVGSDLAAHPPVLKALQSFLNATAEWVMRCSGTKIDSHQAGFVHLVWVEIVSLPTLTFVVYQRKCLHSHQVIERGQGIV